MQPFKPAFKGCVVLPLTDDDEDIKRIKYYGDWHNRKKRLQIIKKPRKYLLTFYFRGFYGEKGVDEVRIIERNSFLDLAEYIKETGDSIINQIGPERVNLKESYVSIKA